MQKIKKEKNKNKKERGITLIALVITIIVLLILAGISISMLSGNNNILKQTANARDKSETKSLKEETQVALMGKQINGYTETQKKSLKEVLESEINESSVEEIVGTDGNTKYTDVYYVKKGNNYITVYEDGDIEEGKVEIWDGEKISCPEIKNENNIWNWYIYTPSQLKFLADFVNNGDGSTLPETLNSYVIEAGYKPENVTMSKDTKINLMNNLDLGARQANGTKINGVDWTPIGIDSNTVFNKLGTFKGNNHTIKGVYINRNQPYNGIFGFSNTIENLIIKDSYIQGGGGTGGVVGVLIGGKVEDCHNKNTTVILNVESNNNVGGIVGTSNITGVSISNCSNTGKVISKGRFAGGIIGAIQTTAEINNCTNNGIVEGKQLYTGGITGYSIAEINKCINNGKIIGESDCTGGIIGYGFTNGLTSKCINNGEVTGNGNSTGGIVGRNI